MHQTYFKRFESTGTMMEAELELLALGEEAIPILASLFSGEACNEFGVQYRNLGLPLRCAIEVAKRLGPTARPLEGYLRKEIERGNSAAAMALRYFQTLEPATVHALAQSLGKNWDGKDWDLAYEATATLIECGEQDAASVLQAIQQSEKAASIFTRVLGWHSKRNIQASPTVKL